MPRYKRKNDGCRISVGKLGFVTPGQIITLPSMHHSLARFFDAIEDAPAAIPPEPTPAVIYQPLGPDEDLFVPAAHTSVIRPSEAEPVICCPIVPSDEAPAEAEPAAEPSAQDALDVIVGSLPPEEVQADAPAEDAPEAHDTAEDEDHSEDAPAAGEAGNHKKSRRRKNRNR